MYKFKVGDTVRVKQRNFKDYVIQEITNDRFCREFAGTMNGQSYFVDTLELVCPAGYRPVREDEMHEYLRVGDAAINKCGELYVFSSVNFWRPYSWYLGTEYTKFFRPIEQCNYGWCDEFSDDCQNGESGLTEEAAKAAAEKFSKENSIETFVYKIVGKFTVKTETKVVWNEV